MINVNAWMRTRKQTPGISVEEVTPEIHIEDIKYLD